MGTASFYKPVRFIKDIVDSGTISLYGIKTGASKKIIL
jgi:hypothetical protein